MTRRTVSTRPAADGGEQGSMLAEVLVGLGILLGVLVALSQLFGLSARQTAASTDITASAYLAADRIEQLRATPYDQLAPGTTTDEVRLRSIVYDRRTTITGDVPLPGTKTIEVEVRPRRQSAVGPSGVSTLSLFRPAEPLRPPLLPSSPGSPASPGQPASPGSA
jgi:hypothetical protein